MLDLSVTKDCQGLGNFNSENAVFSLLETHCYHQIAGLAGKFLQILLSDYQIGHEVCEYVASL